jgi:hypothetical protein
VTHVCNTIQKAKAGGGKLSVQDQPELHNAIKVREREREREREKEEKKEGGKEGRKGKKNRS